MTRLPLVSVALVLAFASACSSSSDNLEPTPSDAQATATAPPTQPSATTAVPTTIVTSTTPERWGDFVLSQDPVTRHVEQPAPRTGINTEGDPWIRDDATVYRDVNMATADTRVPLTGSTPPGHEFFGALILDDAIGPFQGRVTYIRPERRPPQPTGELRPSEFETGTVTILWSLLSSKPAYVSPLSQPQSYLSRSTTYLRATEKAEVNGNKGVLQTYGSRNSPDGAPLIELYWFEGGVFWALRTSEGAALTPNDVLEMAGSIRPVSMTTTSQPPATPPLPTPTPASAPPPVAPQTGIGIVDAVAAAVVGGNVDALMSLMAPETLPCSRRNEPGFIGPFCADGEPEGAPVQAVHRIACSGDIVTPESLRPEVGRLLAQGWDLQAVVAYPNEAFAKYVAIFDRSPSRDAYPRWLGFYIHDRGIAAFVPGCPTWTAFPAEYGPRILYRRS